MPAWSRHFADPQARVGQDASRRSRLEFSQLGRTSRRARRRSSEEVAYARCVERSHIVSQVFKDAQHVVLGNASDQARLMQLRLTRGPVTQCSYSVHSVSRMPFSRMIVPQRAKSVLM